MPDRRDRRISDRSELASETLRPRKQECLVQIGTTAQEKSLRRCDRAESFRSAQCSATDKAFLVNTELLAYRTLQVTATETRRTVQQSFAGRSPGQATMGNGKDHRNSDGSSAVATRLLPLPQGLRERGTCIRFFRQAEDSGSNQSEEILAWYHLQT